LTKMTMNQLRCHLERFDPRVRDYQRRTRSSALLITLTFVALVTILVIAFLGLASQDLKSTYFYVRSDQADQIARAGLDFVVGNLQGEIEDQNLSTTNFGTVQSPFYVPVSGTYSFPIRMVSSGAASTNILLCSSNNFFYTIGQAPPTMSSAIPSTNISLNNQVISVSDWNKPRLVPGGQAANMPIPNWVFISSTGPVTLSATTVSKTVSPSLTNPNAVIGRYAFVVYDTSGLLDINVAGYDTNQPSMATNASGKGLLPYADLTQLPGITAGDVSALVQFRNAVSETNFPQALNNTNGYGLLSNGFMQVYTPATNGPSDTTFLSRQELIDYATNSANTDWTNALPYLTTFSRELNGPTWGPTTNGTPYTFYSTTYSFPYQTTANTPSTAANTATINPNIFAVKVPASWVGNSTNPTRNNGLPWVAGDPLVKYRFPLDKLALLEKMQGTSTLTSSDIANIAAYFGLDPVSDSNGYYRHWQYPTQNSKYLHTNGPILTLAQVAALATPREPDFFELLQAGILNGSLGVWGRGDNPPYAFQTVNAQDFDQKATIQVLRIGANIIDQWDTDSYPTTITFLADSSGDTYNVYGTQDLPYITQMFLKPYSPNGNQTMPVYPYIYFQVWNPHQEPSASVYNSANYPSNFRIVPFYFTGNPTHTAGYSDQYQLWLIVGLTPGTYKWIYNPSSETWSNSPPANPLLSPLGTAYGGGYETNTSAGLNFTLPNPQVNYREPGIVVGTPNPVDNGGGGNPWAPTNPGGGSPPGTLAAISLPEITNYPPTGMTNTSAVGSPTPATTNWNTPSMSTKWQVAMISQTTWVQQFKDQAGNWQTYGTFEGMDSQSIATNTGWAGNQWIVATSSASADGVSWAKTDPRTFRLGPGSIGQQRTGAYVITNIPPNSANPPLLAPISSSSQIANLAWDIWESTPFGDTPSVAATPYRMDYWVANNPNNSVQGPSYSGTNNSPYITDLDGIIRGGDSAYGYSTTHAWGIDPLLPGGSSASSSSQAQALPARPVMLHHPFNSVGDLGYAYRDDPFRTLDFMTPGSADAGLLDLFNLSEAPVVAGRINPNTPYTQIIASLVSGATQSSVTSISGANATVPSSTAQNLATTFVSLTSSTPITNRASIVTSGAVSNIINTGYFSDTNNGTSVTSLVKTEGESLVRSLAESSNTRTWNFLIDVIGQSGHFLNNSALVTSGGKDNFVVDGERHYWLHVAIDRYTGKIVDEQLEIVDQ
jgi:hypothetical protein